MQLIMKMNSWDFDWKNTKMFQAPRRNKKQPNIALIQQTNNHLDKISITVIHITYSIVKDINADLTVGNWNSKKDP